MPQTPTERRSLPLRIACAAALAVAGSCACTSGTTEREPPPTFVPGASSSPATTGTVAAPMHSSGGGEATGGDDEPATADPPSPSAPTDGTSAPDGGAPPGSPIDRNGQLQVVGNQVMNADGDPVVLRGQGFGWDNWWPQYYNADVVSWLRSDWCVDIVRPAMGIEPEGAYLDNPTESQQRVEAVVNAAITNGIYVIVDWHAHDAHQAEAIAFFQVMAQKYGNHPNIIYEIFNEPDEETWPEVKAYSEALIAAIREHDPDNLIVIGTPEWNQRIDEAAADPIVGASNVVYSVHFYAATHGEWLRERTASALAAGLPIIVSESSGSEASGQGENDYAEWQAWIDFMDQSGISWLNYSVSDKAMETISVLEPGASATGGWDEAQLTATGEYIREVFRSYCQ